MMRVFDDNNDGVIDAAELSSVVKEIAAKEAAEREAQKEAARERKISRVFRRFALVLLLALLASVGTNAGLTAGLVIANKDTAATSDGTLTVKGTDVLGSTGPTHVNGAKLADDGGSVLGVGNAMAKLPIYALAAMDIDDLQRVQTLSISYFDGPTKVQTNLRIESQTKQGNMVELVSSLGYKVELKGTRNARLITPDGATFAICAAKAACSSLRVKNEDLQVLYDISPHLPVSPHISPHLPISPHI